MDNLSTVLYNSYMDLTPKDMQKLWELVKFSLSKKFPPEAYKAWIEHATKLSEVTDGKVTIDVRNAIALQWLEKNAKNEVATLFNDFLGGTHNIQFMVKSASFGEGTRTMHKSLKTPQEKDQVGSILDPNVAYDAKFKRALQESALNEKYTFETFIVGAHNQLAHAAATAVAHSLGSAYNPLFIYGSVGIGKTHLMQAVGRRVLEKDPDKKVFYCSSETILNDLVEAIKQKNTASLREKYRKLDLLMIDDIQFISDWQSTQIELFHIFNVLYNAGKQVILASDRPPAEINNLAERLKSRFEGGMVADVTTPDYETRVAILSKYNDEQDPRLPQEIVETIAASVDNNVRQLIGSYTKIHTYAKVSGGTIDKSLAERIIGFDKEAARKKVKLEDILDKVAVEYDVTIGQLKSSTRTASVALPRQIAMYLIRDILNYPLERVARSLKRSDHTTVIHAVDKVTKLMTSDHHVRAQIVALKNDILKGNA